MTGETFFTTIGCMDGRCQGVVDEYGKQCFHALYPDTITEAGLVGILARNPSKDFLEQLKNKILISVQKHNSKGIVVDGHAECAGNPVDDKTHIENVRNAVKVIQTMVGDKVPVVGVFIHRCADNKALWEVENINRNIPLHSQ